MNSSCTQLEVGNMVLRQLWTGLSQIFCEMLSPPIPGVHFLKQLFFPQWWHRNSLTWIHSSLLQPPASAGEGSLVRHHPPPSRSPVICATLSLLLLFIVQKHCLKQHIKTWLCPHWMRHPSYQRLCLFHLWALNSFLSLNQLLNQIYIIFTDVLVHKASQEEFGV